MPALRANLDTLFAASANANASLQNLSWSDVLQNGTTPGVDVDFFGYDASGLGNITTSGTVTGDSLVLNKDATISGKLDVSNVVAFGDSLNVTGVVSFSDSLRVVKSVSIGEKLYVTGVIALGDSLNVVGNVGLEAMLEVAGAAVFGSTIDVTGTTTLRDTLYAMSPALFGDSVNVAGNTHMQGNLQVDGSVNFGGTLGVTGATTLSDDLSVTGETTLSDTLHVNAPGLFSDSLYVAGGAAFGDDVSITGNSTVGGNATVGGNSSVSGTMNVTGATTLGDNLTVSGETTLSDTLHVNAPGLFSDSLYVGGGAAFGDDVSIAGNSTVGGNSSVTGTMSVTGATTLGDNLTVSGETTLSDTLHVNAPGLFSDSLYVGGGAAFGDDVSITGNSSVGGNSTVDGSMNVTGTTTLSDNLTVAGETTLNDSLHVNAPALFGDSVHVAGNMGISGELEVTSLVINGVEIPAIDDTDALPEGSNNLYYTDDRARAAITAGTGVTMNAGEVSIGQEVATTSDVTFDELSVDSIAATGSLNLTGRASLGDSLVVSSGARIFATLYADSLSAGGLAIAGGVQIQDGNQSAGRVLTSDANGNATWQDAVSPYTAGTGVDVTNNVISIGQAVGTTSDVTFADVTADSLITAGLRITDGNQAAGKVLTSDANGKATWQDAVSPYTAGTGVDVTNNVISIGQAVGTTSDVTFDELSVDSIAATGSLTVEDSLVVSSGARVALTLHADSVVAGGMALSGGFRIQDGNQAAGKVLTSDANGLATWQAAVSPYTAGTGVDVTNNVISIGQAVGTTSDVTFDDVTADSLAMTSALTVGGTATFSDSLFAAKAVVLSDSLIVNDGARMTGTLVADSMSTPGLAIGSAFKYANGSQGANKVLQSNANGEATWVTLPATEPYNPSVTVTGVLSLTPLQVASNITTAVNTGSYIDLPPGDWNVQANSIIASDAVNNQDEAAIWVRSGFSTDPNTFQGASVLGASIIAGSAVSPAIYGLATGSVVIRNSGNSTQRYYWFVGSNDVSGSTNPTGLLYNFGTGLWGENSLVATAVSEADNGSAPAPSTITESGDILIREPVTMRGINNPITKPTNMLVDEIALTDDGTGFCTVDIEYSFIDNTGAAGGVGEVRIFTLPAGYEFDLSFHSVSTATNYNSAANGWTFEGMRATLPEGETGWATNMGGAWSKLMVVPYSATEFRLGMIDNAGVTQWTYLGPFFQMIDPHALKVNFRFKSTKAEGGLSRVNISGGTGVTVNTDNEIAIGQDVATTADVTFDDITADSLVTNAVRVIDGNQAVGKVLVSDASGNASWQDFGSGAPKYAQFRGNAEQWFNNDNDANGPSSQARINFPVTEINSGGFVLTNNSEITLPQGRVYRIDLNLGWAGTDWNGGWRRFKIYNTNTNAELSQTAHIEPGNNTLFQGSGTVSTFIDTNSGAVTIDARNFAGDGNIKLNDPGNGTNFVTITIQTVD